jgi:hypothetical protein
LTNLCLKLVISILCETLYFFSLGKLITRIIVPVKKIIFYTKIFVFVCKLFFITSNDIISFGLGASQHSSASVNDMSFSFSISFSMYPFNYNVLRNNRYNTRKLKIFSMFLLSLRSISSHRLTSFTNFL